MTKTFEIPLYASFVALFYKESDDEIIDVPENIISECQISEEELKELEEYSNDNDKNPFMSYSVNGLQVIEIGKELITDSKILFKLICHESYHCACAILDRVGIKYSNTKSEEAFAYLTDYIAGEIYEILEKEFEYFIIKKNRNKKRE